MAHGVYSNRNNNIKFTAPGKSVQPVHVSDFEVFDCICLLFIIYYFIDNA